MQGQTEVILHHVNPNVRGIGEEEEARNRKYTALKLGGGQAFQLTTVLE
jgi:hypothetical protein